MDCFASPAMTALAAIFFQRLSADAHWRFAIPFYMIYVISYQIGTSRGRPDSRDRCKPPSGGHLHRPADRGAGSTRRHRDAGDQYPAALAAADGGVPESVERGGHLRHHHLPCGVRGRPARGRTDFGPLWPALAGADRFCRVLRWQRLVRSRDRPAQSPDRPRRPGLRRLCDFRAVTRDRPRHVLRRRTGARDGADHDRDGGRPRLLAAARRRARSLFRLAFRIRARRGLCRARRDRLRHGAG